MKVSKNKNGKLLETEVTNNHGSTLPVGNSSFLALEPCYTENDIQYKIENDGLENLNAANVDKQKDSMEECRTYCRQLILIHL